MARERYLIDQTEDTIHNNVIELTDKKSVRKNWWHYHKVYLLVGVIALALVGSFIHSIVSKVTPDYQVAFLTAYVWPEDTLEELQNHLQLYGEDLNGDGEVVVQLNTYSLGGMQDEDADPTQMQAIIVRITADISEMESVIFLHDEEGFASLLNMGVEGLFVYRDGTDMPDDATDYENAMRNWADVPGLEAFHVQASSLDYLTPEDIDDILREYRVSLRVLTPRHGEKADHVRTYEGALALYQRLMNNEILQKEQ